MRETIPLNRGWFFARGFSENDFSPSCPPPGEQVELPHANTLLPYNYLDETSYQFVSCYLRLLCAPASWAGRRVFLAFEGVMACAEVFCNGRLAGSHKGGYTAFRVELTELLVPGAENRLLVRVDSTERADFPPCGNVVDYLTYGGIYREVTLLVTEREAIRHLAVSPVRTPSGERLELRVELEEPLARDAQLRADILGHGARLQALLPAPAGSSVLHIAFDDTSSLRRWSPEEPVLYDARTTLLRDGQELDRLSARFGFRLCEFRPDGFYLNGRRRKLVGFNRHQSYPYVGNAMPRRIQRRDAEFIKELGANTVRTSHYPQSRHFLDRCDELGLLVFEEIPGWQHIGGPAWQDAAVRNVEEMIRADYNHPSIILWGVRINESADDPAFYARTNAKAHELDQTRQTGGVRCHPRGDFQEDVYTFNDFIHSGGPLVFRSRQEITGLPQEVPLLVTESNGHMYPTKRFDPEARLLEHAMRHLRVRDEALGRSDLVGELSWCAFDYNTHGCFGSGDKICYHGVSDMFRIPKFAGLACMSQRPLAEGAVLEPLSLVSRGERDGGGIIPIDVPGIDGKNVVKSEDIKAMCNGIVPEGKGMIWKAAVAAIKAQGGTVGFMRMGLNMKSGPTAIVGKRVVVVGGGFAGLEVAEAMCDGREIWVIDPAKKLGNGIGIIDKNPTINLLKKKGVHLMPLTELIEVTKKGAKVKNVETGEEQLIECDTVLTSLGVEQNTDLYDEIVKVWPHAKLIGDATTPDGKVYRTLEAVKGGYQASMAI